MTMAYSKNAYAMWNDLKKRYWVANTPKIHQLKVTIANCKQGSLEVGEFYSRLTNLWNELNNHAKIPKCSCKGYKCGASEQIVAMYEEDKTHQFLMGLNDDLYSQVRGANSSSRPASPS